MKLQAKVWCVVVSCLCIPLTTAQKVDTDSAFIVFQPSSIKVKKDRRIIRRLNNLKPAAVEKVLSKPNNYSPPVLFSLAHALYLGERKDLAVFWFHVAKLRTLSDIAKSRVFGTDNVHRVFIAEYGLEIVGYSLEDQEKTEQTVIEAIAWDAEQSRSYDARWITLLGLEGELGLYFANPSQWLKIDQATRERYPSDSKDNVVCDPPTSDPFRNAVNIVKVTPRYPPEYLEAKLEETVIVRFDITDRGLTENVRAEATNDLFAQAAIKAVSKFAYGPAVVNCEPVPVRNTALKISFKPGN